jgi:rhodanese-related sulfurtransferase
LDRDVNNRQPSTTPPLLILTLALFPLIVWADDFLSPGLTPAELLDRLDSPTPPLVVDVRKPVEFGVAHIPGAINIPLAELEARIDELRNEHGVLIYCINGARTRQAEPIVYANDIEDVYHLDGALQGWIQGGHPIEKGGVTKSGW